MDEAERAAQIVYPLFQHHGWTYFDGPPTVARLAEQFRLLRHSVEKPETFASSSGRLEVQERGDRDHGDFQYIYLVRVGAEDIA